MGLNVQCKFCMHSSVCAYREHYEEAEKLYEKVREECDKYPVFKCRIECAQYRKDSYFNEPILRRQQMGMTIDEAESEGT